jgi:hypothetical protein
MSSPSAGTPNDDRPGDRLVAPIVHPYCSLMEGSAMKPTELRCKCCRTLLGTKDEDGLTIQRGGMQATIPGAPTVVIICYRCSKTNVFSLLDKKPSG